MQIFCLGRSTRHTPSKTQGLSPYYNPVDAVFLTMDTARNGGDLRATLSLYGYTEGDPINKIDPTGHFSIRAAITNRVNAVAQRVRAAALAAQRAAALAARRAAQRAAQQRARLAAQRAAIRAAQRRAAALARQRAQVAAQRAAQRAAARRAAAQRARVAAQRVAQQRAQRARIAAQQAARAAAQARARQLAAQRARQRSVQPRPQPAQQVRVQPVVNSRVQSAGVTQVSNGSEPRSQEERNARAWRSFTNGGMLTLGGASAISAGVPLIPVGGSGFVLIGIGIVGVCAGVVSFGIAAGHLTGAADDSDMVDTVDDALSFGVDLIMAR